MNGSQFVIGGVVKVLRDVDLADGAVGYSAPVIVHKGEQATVTDFDGDLARLVFSRSFAYPEEFGGASPEVWVCAPDMGTGMSFDDIEPI